MVNQFIYTLKKGLKWIICASEAIQYAMFV